MPELFLFFLQFKLARVFVLKVGSQKTQNNLKKNPGHILAYKIKSKTNKTKIKPVWLIQVPDEICHVYIKFIVSFVL